MIWLSTMAGAQECSIYFEIRDIDIQRTGASTEGVVRGLLGDGRYELWSEVYLGDAPRVQILSEWDESGEIVGFDSELDETILQQQLLLAVQSVFNQIGTLLAPIQSSPENYVINKTEKQRSCLAA